MRSASGGGWLKPCRDRRGPGHDGHLLLRSALTLAAADQREHLAAWIADPAVRAALGVHEADDIEWLDGDAVSVLIERVALAQILDGTAPRTARTRAARLRRVVERARYRADTLVAPVPRRRA